MIQVICKTDNSNITYLEVTGHASNSSKNALICASVSCLTRTVCEIISRMNGVDSICSAPDPGNVVLEIYDIKKSIQEHLSGITDFYLLGIIGIINDYPESIILKINNKEWYDGSQERWW